MVASTTAETLNVTVVDDASSSTTSPDVSTTSPVASSTSDSSPSPAASQSSQASPLPKENVPAKDKSVRDRVKRRGKHSKKRQLTFLLSMEPNCDTSGQET